MWFLLLLLGCYPPRPEFDPLPHTWDGNPLVYMGHSLYEYGAGKGTTRKFLLPETKGGTQPPVWIQVRAWGPVINQVTLTYSDSCNPLVVGDLGISMGEPKVGQRSVLRYYFWESRGVTAEAKDALHTLECTLIFRQDLR